jgi:hypothetical protein
MMHSGLGKVFSTFQTGQAKAETIRAYNRAGEEAAQNIRTKFYQEEWKQAKQARIDPLMSQLNELKSAFEANSTVAVRPIPRNVGLEEGEMIAQAGARPGAPVKTGEGKTAAGPPEVPPNPALLQGQIGAVEMIEAPSIINPMTGVPVASNSPEGYAIYQKMVDDFWGQYGRLTTEMINITSEYAGNPFADNALGNVIEKVMNQAGQGVTGRADPIEQAQHWEDRRKADAEIEASQLAAEGSRFELDQKRAQQDALTQAARADVADPRSRPWYGDKLATKMESGASLTKKEKATVAGIYGVIRQREMEDRRAAQQQGLTRIPRSIFESMGTWHDYVKTNDAGYKLQLEENLLHSDNALIREIRQDPLGYVERNRANLTEDLQREISLGALSEPAVKAYIEHTARTPDVINQAHVDTYASVLQRIASNDRDVALKIQEEIDNTRAAGIEAGIWNEELEEKSQIDPINFIVTMTTQTDPNFHAPNYAGKREAYRASLPTPLSRVEPEPEAEQERPLTKLAPAKRDIREIDVSTLSQEEIGTMLERLRANTMYRPRTEEEDRQIKRLEAQYQNLGKRVATTIGEIVEGAAITMEERKQRADLAKKQQFILE